MPAIFVLLVASCSSPRRAPPPAISADPPPTPAAPEPPPADRCALSLPKKVEFGECSAKPRTRDYPDCRSYTVERIDGDSSCQPERLSVTVSGLQVLPDSFEPKVVWEMGPPRKARLVLDQGTPLGSILFESGAPHTLLLGPRLRTHTDQTTAKLWE